LQKRLNITSVYVTHDQIEAMALSDRIVVMNQGRIEQIGKPEDIYRYPATRFVADFIGRANFLDTQAEVVSGQVTVHILGKTLTFPAADFIRQNQKVTAMLRPESLRLHEAGDTAQGRVEYATYLGSEVEYLVSVDGMSLVVVDSDPHAHRIFAPGDGVGIDFLPEVVHLLPPE
jgi:iron(III) transport system ATP-binding protein